MYRDSERSSVAGDLSRDNGWRDWPAETTPARFEGEPDVAPSQLRKAPAARGDHSDAPTLRSPAPNAPAARREISVLVEDQTVTIKDQLVLPTD